MLYYKAHVNEEESPSCETSISMDPRSIVHTVVCLLRSKNLDEIWEYRRFNFERCAGSNLFPMPRVTDSVAERNMRTVSTKSSREVSQNNATM